MHNIGAPDMDNNEEAERAALLIRSYEGELIGSAMYEKLMHFHTGRQREALELLRDMEQVTAEALSSLIEKYSVIVDPEKSRLQGLALAEKLKDREWKDMWRDVVELADDYLDDFRRLEELLGANDSRIGRQVVEHETTMIEFAKKECADDQDAAQLLREHLHQYSR